MSLVELVIVIVIVFLAAGFVLWRAYQTLRGRTGSCCSSQGACDSSAGEEQPVNGAEGIGKSFPLKGCGLASGKAGPCASCPGCSGALR